MHLYPDAASAAPLLVGRRWLPANMTVRQHGHESHAWLERTPYHISAVHSPELEKCYPGSQRLICSNPGSVKSAPDPPLTSMQLRPGPRPEPPYPSVSARRAICRPARIAQVLMAQTAGKAKKHRCLVRVTAIQPQEVKRMCCRRSELPPSARSSALTASTLHMCFHPEGTPLASHFLSRCCAVSSLLGPPITGVTPAAKPHICAYSLSL